ncbi:MAG: protease pro-enzyme activation domain-containing protein [Thermoplasmata archaeon]
MERERVAGGHRRRAAGIPRWGPIVAAAILAVSALSVVAPTAAASPSLPSSGGASVALTEVGAPLSSLLSAPRLPVPADAGLPLDPAIVGPYSGPVSVFVSFPFSHPAALASLLANLSDPSSPEYHRYLTRTEFDAAFAGNLTAYADAARYFASFPGVTAMTFADRSGILLQGPARALGAAFGIGFGSARSASGGPFYLPLGRPTLPGPIARDVQQVIGLSSGAPLAPTLAGPPQHPAGLPSAPARVDGYPSPVEVGGTQYLYGADLQVAYDEQGLLQIAMPTAEVVATILWAGCTVTTQPCPSGDLTAPFDPSDVYGYFNTTLPAGQPHSPVYGVPLGGAPPPGPSASRDVTNAVEENTLDLSMVGSTAPGATIYNVYGPSDYTSDADAAMAYILNPTSTPGLDNVSVVSNSWGGSDRVDAAWSGYMQEAAARGITVLAATGDAGDNPNSPAWVGTAVEFPSSVGFDTYGTIGVGGTTLTLVTSAGPSYLHIASQVAWYEPGPGYGSSGGTSTQYAMPSWQAGTEARTYIDQYGQGGQRGTPDLSAVANNTIIELGGASATLIGTSIACPVTAGLLAEIDAVLAAYGQPALGFVDPVVYAWANELLQQPTAGTTPVGAVFTGGWRSVLPATPVNDVVRGQNYLYPAAVGYDLVTGWGSLDAYNFTAFVLNDTYAGAPFSARGVRDVLQLNALEVTSSGPDATYNASVQQNFFVANSLGAPLYWVQNVIFLSGTPARWSINFTGWVIYPFYGLYPDQSVYLYNFPVNGSLGQAPFAWTITSAIAGYGASAMLDFQVNSVRLSLPLPGGQYIIAGENYSYYWQGQQYTDGPYPSEEAPWGLVPQFGLLGGPTGGLGHFGPATTGVAAAYLEMTGSPSYVPAPLSSSFGYFGSQTSEAAANLSWTPSGPSSWGFGYANGSRTQGIAMYATAFAGNPANRSQTHQTVQFNATGLPAGTAWSVDLGGTIATTTASALSLSVAWGSYPWAAFTTGSAYRASPGTGVVTVGGAGPATVAVPFVPMPRGTYFASVLSQGLPGLPWSASVGNITQTSTGLMLGFALGNGSYSYRIGNVPGWRANGYGGTIVVAGLNPPPVLVRWNQTLYRVVFTESGLPSGTWSVSIGGSTQAAGAPGAIVWSLPNGSYAFTVGSVPGYLATPQNGSFAVHGSGVSIGIGFAASGNSVSSLLDRFCLFGACGLPALLLVLGLAAAFGAVAAAGATLGRRSERRERLAPSSPSPSAPSAPAAPPPPAACVHCGAPLAESDHFCSRCGAPRP